MERAATIIVIEDEAQIRRFLRTALEAEGCAVFEAATAARGLIDAGTRKPDLVVLDLGLPDRDGVEVVRDIRNWSGMPILILSARSDESDKVAALDAGADDYLTKPFSIAELQARVRALLRRAARARPDEPTARFGDVEVDLARRLVSRAGEEVHLTPIEYRLLAQLIANAGRVMTHRQLLNEVWGPGHGEDSHYLRVYMASLRRKLEADANRPRHLRTESGVGYRLVMGE
jgi:two-component system KDP operon response regulator KdpE